MSWFDSGPVEYFSFRLSTHLDYRRAKLHPQVRTLLEAWGTEFVRIHPTSVLSDNDDWESLLELGIRYGFLLPPSRTVQEPRLTNE